MKKVWTGLFVLALSSCAAHQTTPDALDCRASLAADQGTRDARADLPKSEDFLGDCSPESRPEAKKAYRHAYRVAVKAKRRSIEKANADAAEEAKEDAEEPDETAAAPAPASVKEPSWVCEIEAYSNVFTGIGFSKEEALTSAQSTCGSHFQASYCQKGDCKQNL